MAYKNIFNINKNGSKTVSAYAKCDETRMYNEIIIGYNIKPENIRTRRFDYSVSVCQTPQELKKALTRYSVTRFVNNDFKVELKKYMPGI